MTDIFESVHNQKDLKIGDNIRGECGETIARLFLVQHGFRISIVSGGWYPYDMIAERHGKSRRIQVKTTTRKTSDGRYFRASFGLSDEFDDAFIITSEGTIFVIPFKDLVFESPSGKNSSRNVVLFPKYKKFIRGNFPGFGPGNTDITIKKLEKSA